MSSVGSITSVVYFIQGDDETPIKIGMTSNLEQRLRQIQPSCPYKLKVLCQVYGYIREEHYLHKKFEQHRLHNEWFKPAEEILELVDKINQFNLSEYPIKMGKLIPFIQYTYGIPPEPHKTQEDFKEWKRYGHLSLREYQQVIESRQHTIMCQAYQVIN